MKTLLEQVHDLNLVNLFVTIFVILLVTQILGNLRASKTENRIIDEIRISREETRYLAQSTENIILNQNNKK